MIQIMKKPTNHTLQQIISVDEVRSLQNTTHLNSSLHDLSYAETCQILSWSVTINLYSIAYLIFMILFL